VALIGEKRNPCTLGRPEGKRPLEGHGRRRENDDTTPIKEIVWKKVNWIDLAQDRDKWRAVVNTVMNFRDA
jgi:hypothetical protein